MSRQSRQSRHRKQEGILMSEGKILKRIEKLEGIVLALSGQISDLTKSLKKGFDIKNGKSITINGFNSKSTLPSSLGNVLGVHVDRTNPWTVDAVLRLMDNQLERDIVISSINTYRPTVNALIQENRPMTATEVANRTNRARNTESAYLNKLNKAGLVIRRKKKGKVTFEIGSTDTIEKVLDIRIR